MTIKGIGTTMYQWDMEYRKRGLDFQENLGMAFEEIASYGFDGIESRLVYADSKDKASRFAQLCRDAGLKLGSLYGSCKLYDRNNNGLEVDRFMAKAEACRDAGCSLIILDMGTPHDRDKTDEELKAQVDALNRLGAKASEIGLRIGIHNHTPEMKHNGKEFRYMMDNVSEHSIGICLDIAWTTMAGVSAEELIEKYNRRLFDIHVRNFADGHFTQSVTEGSILYPRVLQILNEHEYNGWLIVELAYDDHVKLTRSFAENIARSLWYVKGLTSAY